MNLSKNYSRTARVTLSCQRYLVLYMAPLDMCGDWTALNGAQDMTCVRSSLDPSSLMEVGLACVTTSWHAISTSLHIFLFLYLIDVNPSCSWTY